MKTFSASVAMVLLMVGAATASSAFAQATPTPADVKQKLSGARLSSVRSDGRQEAWVNAADGTISATLSGTQSSKAGKRTLVTGHWSVADDGKYCLHVDWDIQEGGPEDWCTPVVAGNDGALTLATPDGRKISIAQ